MPFSDPKAPHAALKPAIDAALIDARITPRTRALMAVSVAAPQQVLSLPMSADLSEADQDRVVAALRTALRV